MTLIVPVLFWTPVREKIQGLIDLDNLPTTLGGNRKETPVV